MLFKKCIAVILVIFTIMLMPFAITGAHNQDLKIYINGINRIFSPAPFIENGRTLVPMRAFFESLGVRVNWDADTRTAIGEKDGIRIEIPIGQFFARVNNRIYSLDIPARIKNDRTFIPLRFVGESLGEKVAWENKTRTIRVGEQGDKILAFAGISIGTKKDEVINKLGQPARIDASKYNFDWYVYNQDYRYFVMVGIRDNEVKGLYSNSMAWKCRDGIKIGVTTKTEIEELWGNPLKGILKGNTNYIIDSQGEYDVFKIEDNYVTVFYDIHDNNIVTAIQIVKEDIEQALAGFYSQGNIRLQESYERQIFDLANAIRIRKGLAPFIWDTKAQITAQGHSKDMGFNDYFSHTNLKGQSPFDRMTANGIHYYMAAENIACGQTSAIFAHEGWMNSKGHRYNILGDCERLGVGVWFGGSYSVYYTQNFYIP